MTTRWLTALLPTFALAAALAFTGHGAAAPMRGELQVAYTMDCTFAILDESGRSVTRIEPGTYGVVISTPMPFGSVRAPGTDGYTACNGWIDFDLTGPGVSIHTTLGDGSKAEERHVATFEAGRTYTAVESKRPATAHLGVLSSPGGGTGASPQPDPNRLVATVGLAGRTALAVSGKRVAELRPGRRVVVLTDRSRSAGLVLRRANGKGRAIVLSTPGFVGRKTTVVMLTTGAWLFSSGKGAPIRFVVTTP